MTREEVDELQAVGHMLNVSIFWECKIDGDSETHIITVIDTIFETRQPALFAIVAEHLEQYK